MTADTSLFTYTDGMSTANYSFPDHMPVFLDELSNETIASAKIVCGNDSQCIYDFSQTGNEELAMATTTINQENVMNQMIEGMCHVSRCDYETKRHSMHALWRKGSP